MCIKNTNNTQLTTPEYHCYSTLLAKPYVSQYVEENSLTSVAFLCQKLQPWYEIFKAK